MVDLFLELFSPNSRYHPPPSLGLLWGSLDLCSHITTSPMIFRLNYDSISLCHWEILVSLLSTKVISKWLKPSWIYDEVLNPCDGVTSIKDTDLQSGIKWRTAGILVLTSSSSSSKKPSLVQVKESLGAVLTQSLISLPKMRYAPERGWNDLQFYSTALLSLLLTPLKQGVSWGTVTGNACWK